MGAGYLYPLERSLIIGGYFFPKSDLDSSNFKQLWVSDTGTGNFSTVREANGTAGYVIPGGQTLKILAWKAWTTSTTGNIGFKLLYGDNDVGFASAGAPTNPVYLMGSSADNSRFGIQVATGPNFIEGACNFDILTGKYPAIKGLGGPITVALYGMLR